MPVQGLRALPSWIAFYKWGPWMAEWRPGDVPTSSMRERETGVIACDDQASPTRAVPQSCTAGTAAAARLV